MYVLSLITGGSSNSGFRLTSSAQVALAVQNTQYNPSPTVSFATSEGWLLLVATKPAGTSTAKVYKYVYGTDAWASGTVASVPDPSTTIAMVGIGDGAFRFQGDIAAGAWFNYALTDDQVLTLPYSLGAWTSLAPKGMWVLDQPATAQHVVDWTGNGSNENDISGSTVSTSSVPILGYGHPVILKTRQAGAPPASAAPPPRSAFRRNMHLLTR
jgi:hypothetical protein